MTPAPPSEAAVVRRRRPLVILLIAHYLSSFGNAVTLVTVPLYVLGVTGSSFSTGLAGFANTLPLIFAGAVGGVWIDRVGGKWVSVFCDLLAGVFIGLIPLLNDTVGLSLPVLMGLLFVRSLGSTPSGAARQSTIKPLAELAGVRLESANSWLQAGPRLGLLIGAPLAGLLAVAAGPVLGMYIDSATFLLSALLIALALPAGKIAPGSRQQGFLRQLTEGVALVKQIPVIGAMTAFVFVTNLLDDAFAPVILPVYSDQVLGGGQYLGWLLAASGCGAVAGTFLYGPASKRLLTSRRWTLLGCFAVIGVLRLAFGAELGPVLSIAVSFLLGLAAGPLNPALSTVMLEKVPEAMRGRVFALTGAVAMSAAPVGILAAGWAIDGIGLRWTLFVFGTSYLVLVLVSLRRRALHDMDTPPLPEEPDPGAGTPTTADAADAADAADTATTVDTAAGGPQGTSRGTVKEQARD
ncbi:MFS transporter [Streptomyces sp. NBC_00335]|uniref:MFS transporter n=1 Tax=unclassified Streptomyces TaxID=2593676 RepID=UPI00224DE31C|nr:MULTISPECIES: MFS transporter [unclassified Streptomyces]MCX5403589.1 MFS transporter [Streptomyces sp. NBC_00086]